MIDCNVAAVTVSPKLFETTPFWLAVMLLEPIAAPVAIPAALIVTTEEFELAHVEVPVRS